MNWPSTFGCFCLARMKLASTRPLRWIDFVWLLPDIFTEKEGTGASKTTVSVLSAKNKTKLYALRKLVSWSMFQLCPRTACLCRNLWCLSGPAGRSILAWCGLALSIATHCARTRSAVSSRRLTISSPSRNPLVFGAHRLTCVSPFFWVGHLSIYWQSSDKLKCFLSSVVLSNRRCLYEQPLEHCSEEMCFRFLERAVLGVYQ